MAEPQIKSDDLAAAPRPIKTGERQILAQISRVVAAIEANQQLLTDAELIEATEFLYGLTGALDAWCAACGGLLLELHEGGSKH
jgi:hypothetical protein